MTTLREAAQQALEALWTAATPQAEEAITALKAALEQPEQAEPVAWFNGKPVYHVPPRCSNCASLHAVNAELLEALKLALPQLIGHAERTARAAIARAEGKV